MSKMVGVGSSFSLPSEEEKQERIFAGSQAEKPEPMLCRWHYKNGQMCQQNTDLMLDAFQNDGPSMWPVCVDHLFQAFEVFGVLFGSGSVTVLQWSPFILTRYMPKPLTTEQLAQALQRPEPSKETPTND